MKLERKTAERSRRDSMLTFAAIWDPERGLEAFSGAELLDAFPGREDHSIPKTVCYNSNCFSEDPADTAIPDEPFAVFSSRQTHFIDIRSSAAYQKCIRGHDFDDTALDMPLHSSSSESSYSDDTCDSFFGGTEMTTPSRASPVSAPNISAPWNADTGLSARQKSNMVTPIGTNRQPKMSLTSASNTFARSTGRKVKSQDGHGLGYIEKTSAWLRFAPLGRSRSTSYAIPSSTLEDMGGKHSCYDPFRRIPPLVAHRTFSQCEENLGTQETHSYHLAVPRGRSNEQMIDDEGFFETSSHADCDPHLPSRFSMSTTSTSTYIAVDPNATRPNTPTAFGPSSFWQATRDTRSSPPRFRLACSKSSLDGSKLREWRASHDHPAIARRLSKVFKAPWAKRPQDERWVLVEVHSIVTDRIIDD
ncbi:hypothetical protein BDZ97DRAFT_1916713 [Flammula alnicola]|nr:hypothetical protein BDZ97DRAFT_1916713 [Flammula alnicola]